MYNKIYGTKSTKQFYHYIPKNSSLSNEKRSYSSKYEIKSAKSPEKKGLRTIEIPKTLTNSRSFTSNDKSTFGSKIREKKNYIYYVSGVGYVNSKEESKLKKKPISSKKPTSPKTISTKTILPKNISQKPIPKTKTQLLKAVKKNENEDSFVQRKKLIDNYQYHEIKNIKKGNKESNVIHKRLAQPFEYIEQIKNNKNTPNIINQKKFSIYDAYKKSNLKNSISTRNINNSYNSYNNYNNQIRLKNYPSYQNLKSSKKYIAKDINEKTTIFTPKNKQKEKKVTYYLPQSQKKSLRYKNLYNNINSAPMHEVTPQELLNNNKEHGLLPPPDEKYEEDLYSTISNNNNISNEQIYQQEKITPKQSKIKSIYKSKNFFQQQGSYYCPNDNILQYPFQNISLDDVDNFKYYESKNVTNKNDGSITLLHKRGKKSPEFKTEVFTKYYGPIGIVKNQSNYYSYYDNDDINPKGDYPFQVKVVNKKFKY